MVRKIRDAAAGRGGRFEIRDGKRVRVMMTSTALSPVRDPFGPNDEPAPATARSGGSKSGGSKPNKEG